MTLRIALWSGPRNVSTALMYSFRSRPDCSVVDEPLYAYYLARSGADHPGRDDVLAAQSTDPRSVFADVFQAAYRTELVFFKNMAHHLDGLSLEVLDGFDANIILTRDPSEMLPSLVHQVPRPDLAATSLPMQVAILERELRSGRRPVVIESGMLLRDPRRILGRVCATLGVAFDDAMLSWEPGPKPEDGVWAPHWYDRVHASDGFAPYRPKGEPVPPHLRALHDEAMPLYRRLVDHALS